jgi:hypothetical protein
MGWLGQALEREGARLYAYALMTNHVHLLLTPARGDDLRGGRTTAPVSASCCSVLLRCGSSSEP